MEKICPKCQKRNIAQALFCADCGNSLKDVPVTQFHQTEQVAPKSQLEIGTDFKFRKGIVNQILAILLILTFFLPVYNIKNVETEKTVSISMFELISKTIPDIMKFTKKIDNLSEREKNKISEGLNFVGTGFMFKNILFFITFLGVIVITFIILLNSVKEKEPAKIKKLGIINAVFIFAQMVLTKSIIKGYVILVQYISQNEFFGSYSKPDMDALELKISEAIGIGGGLYLGIILSLAFIFSESFEKNILKIDYLMPASENGGSYLQKIPNKYIFWTGIIIFAVEIFIGIV